MVSTVMGVFDGQPATVLLRSPPRVSLCSQEAHVFADSKACLYLVSYVSTQAWTFLDESLWPLGKTHGTQLFVFRSWKMLEGAHVMGFLKGGALLLTLDGG